MKSCSSKVPALLNDNRDDEADDLVNSEHRGILNHPQRNTRIRLEARAWKGVGNCTEPKENNGHCFRLNKAFSS
jgi:hypothetical protein